MPVVSHPPLVGFTPANPAILSPLVSSFTCPPHRPKKLPVPFCGEKRKVSNLLANGFSDRGISWNHMESVTSNRKTTNRYAVKKTLIFNKFKKLIQLNKQYQKIHISHLPIPAFRCGVYKYCLILFVLKDGETGLLIPGYMVPPLTRPSSKTQPEPAGILQECRGLGEADSDEKTKWMTFR